MIAFSPTRAKRLTLAVGVAGTAAALLMGGPREGAGFGVGAAISFLSIHSWLQMAEALGGGHKTRSVGASALFTALRYLVIGAAIYVTIKVLGTSPVAMISGLLAAFGGVVLEILYANRKS